MEKLSGEFPGGPVVKTPRSHCRGPGSTPGWGAKIPRAVRCGQKKKKKKKEKLPEDTYSKKVNVGHLWVTWKQWNFV